MTTETKSKVQCDGLLIEWTPVWEPYESDVCNCCRCDCEGCTTEIKFRDIAEPPFHRAVHKHPSKKDHKQCTVCWEEWLDVAGVLKKVYSVEFFKPFMNTSNPFFEAIEK